MLTVLRRALAALLLVALSTMSLTVLGVTAASASTTGPGESQFVAKINAARAAAGRPGLSSAGDLVTIARRHSAQMAADANIYHNPHLTTGVTGWKIVGENVGQGPTVDALQTAFMNSPAHRDNILDPQYTQVGIGTVVNDRGQMFVTEVFRLPQAAASRPAPKPAAVPVAAKPAAPKPAAVAPVAPKPAAAAPAAGKTASSKPAPARPAPQPAATKPAVPAAPGTGDTAAAVATAPAAASQPTLADRLALARHARATASPASTATDPLSRVSAYTAVMRALAG